MDLNTILLIVFILFLFLCYLYAIYKINTYKRELKDLEFDKVISEIQELIADLKEKQRESY